MIWTNEEYLNHMTFVKTGRELFTELFGLLIGLDEEWKSQGASEKEIALSAFGWDYVKYTYVPFSIRVLSGITPGVVSESESEQISIDVMGRTMCLSKKCATIALPKSYPVQSPSDWERVKHWYRFTPERFDFERLITLKEMHREGVLTILAMPGGYDEPRCLMGEEALSYAYYDEPEMIEDMMQTFGDLMDSALEVILNETPVDLVTVHEDMAGASGPMIGPKLVREFISPYYRRVWDKAKQGGARLFSQDSDGNIEALIDEFLDAGINCMYPMEPKAGMDILKLRKKYGKKLAFKGGIDKFALRGSREDIRRELEYKLVSPLTGGGTAFALDHRIPNGISIDNYRYYVNLGREMLGLEPCAEGPFVRMAF